MGGDLLGPELRDGNAPGAPSWWTRGARVKRKVDGQAAVAAFGQNGAPVALLQRGVTGTFRVEVDVTEWEPDDADGRLTPLQVARVAYEADRVIRTVGGEPGIPEWSGLPEQIRIQWMWTLQQLARARPNVLSPRERTGIAIFEALGGRP